MCNQILDYAEQRLGEKVNFFYIDIDIRESSYSVKRINSPSNNLSVWSFHNIKQFFRKAEERKKTK